ncbi:MAG: hypothetical protein RLZZ217_2193, partial [Planctomycetota bacterium]
MTTSSVAKRTARTAAKPTSKRASKPAATPTAHAPVLTASQHARMMRWLLELTALPTAAGREHRVMAWIDQWLMARADQLAVRRDDAGNYLITRRDLPRGAQQVLMTAHLDHPAFVVTRIERGRVHLEFRGGVLDAYFAGARLEAFDAGDAHHALRIERADLKATPFKTVIAMPTGTA